MTINTPPHIEFIQASDELYRLGVSLEIAPGEYRVSMAGVCVGDACFFDDLAEAIEAGRSMAENAKTRLAPMGPCGRRNTRRGQMYRHNLMIAAMRRGGKGRA
jgi:hypothetical protein